MSVFIFFNLKIKFFTYCRNTNDGNIGGLIEKFAKILEISVWVCYTIVGEFFVKI